MTNPIFHLYQIQKLDSRLDSAQERIRNVTEILEKDSRITEAEQILDEKKKEHHERLKHLQYIEESVHEKKMKIEQSEASLYGGGIRNPKELQDLQKEIASIKINIQSMEETELITMIELENAEKELSAADKNLLSTKNAVYGDQFQLISEKEKLGQEIHKLEQERSAVVSQISFDNIKLYEDLRKKKKGIAVAIIEDQCCSICGATLTPAECQMAKTQNSFYYCTSCGRLLYAG